MASSIDVHTATAEAARRVCVFLQMRWNVLSLHMWVYMYETKVAEHEIWTVCALCRPATTCVRVNSREGSCTGIPMCQVGLVKCSTGREGHGGDLPWPVSDLKDTTKTKQKITTWWLSRKSLPPRQLSDQPDLQRPPHFLLQSAACHGGGCAERLSYGALEETPPVEREYAL